MEEASSWAGARRRASQRASGVGDDEEEEGDAVAKKGFKAVGCSPPQSMDG